MQTTPQNPADAAVTALPLAANDPLPGKTPVPAAYQAWRQAREAQRNPIEIIIAKPVLIRFIASFLNTVCPLLLYNKYW